MKKIDTIDLGGDTWIEVYEASVDFGNPTVVLKSSLGGETHFLPHAAEQLGQAMMDAAHWARRYTRTEA